MHFQADKSLSSLTSWRSLSLVSLVCKTFNDLLAHFEAGGLHKAARSAFSHHFLESGTERDAYIRQVDALRHGQETFCRSFPGLWKPFGMLNLSRPGHPGLRRRNILRF